MLLFDDPEKAITSKEKAADNKVDELNKIIDEATKDMNHQPSSTNIPQDTNTTFQGENYDFNACPHGEQPAPQETNIPS